MNKKLSVNFKLIDPNIKTKTPIYSTEYSSGMDIYSSEELIIYPGETKMVGTNIAIELPSGYEAQVRSKSGLAAKKGVFVLNSPGTIDCFSGDTLIKTIEGNKLITDVKINDIILSYNIEDNKIEEDTIVAIVNKGKLNTIIIETENDKIEISEDTFIYTNNGLKLAKDLTYEDEILVF